MSVDLIEHNPLLKRPLLKMLTLIEQTPEADRGYLEALAAHEDDGLFSKQSPTTIVDILIRNNAVEEFLTVDGEVYAGTLHDVQTDTHIADDATVEQEIFVTESGQELLEAYSEGTQLRKLFADKPHYVEVYKTMLAACSVEGGCSRTELEHILEALPELAPNPVTGEKRIYPQFFIDSLETADGIAWRGSWQTTDAGRLVR